MLEQIASLSVASLSTVTLIGILTRPFKKRIEAKMHEWDEMAAIVHNELSPNGGYSIKDRIEKIHTRLERVEAKVDASKP